MSAAQASAAVRRVMNRLISALLAGRRLREGFPAAAQRTLRGRLYRSAHSLAMEKRENSSQWDASIFIMGMFIPGKRAGRTMPTPAIALQAALDFCAAHPAAPPREIRFVLIDQATLDVFRAEFEQRGLR